MSSRSFAVFMEQKQPPGSVRAVIGGTLFPPFPVITANIGLVYGSSWSDFFIFFMSPMNRVLSPKTTPYDLSLLYNKYVLRSL